MSLTKEYLDGLVDALQKHARSSLSETTDEAQGLIREHRTKEAALRSALGRTQEPTPVVKTAAAKTPGPVRQALQMEAPSDIYRLLAQTQLRGGRQSN